MKFLKMLYPQGWVCGSVYAFDKAYRAQQEQNRRFGWTLREPRTERTPANYHYIPLWLHGFSAID